DHVNAVSAVAGHGMPRVQNGQLTIEGHLSQTTEAGKLVVSLAREGLQLGASVGVHPDKVERVRAGDKATVNGKQLTAGQRGLTIIRSGSLREVSLTPVPADSTTSVSVAAKG